MMTLSEKFLTDVEDFLRREAITPTAFGRNALNDPNFVFDLRAGRSPSAAVIDRVQQYIASRRAGAE